MFRFRLKASIMAVYYGVEGKGEAVIIPAGSEIVTDDLSNPRALPDQSRLVKVGWNGKTVSMFLVDLLDRGERLLHARI